MKSFLLSLLALLCSASAFAQNNIGINTTSPDPSAVLDITSTSQGVLVPRMTAAERAAIAAPAYGLLVYQTDGSPGFYYWDGAWRMVGVPSGSLVASETEVNPALTNAGFSLAYTVAQTILVELPNPNDTWTPTATSASVQGRQYHSAIWTGTEMLVWGGYDNTGSLSNTGSRYNPTTDTWLPMSTTGAPEARAGQSTIWTGTEMIVWGGQGLGNGSSGINTGGRYNPTTDTWTPTSIPPFSGITIEALHKAVWTGNEMIIWGGPYLGSRGLRYYPATDTWDTTAQGIHVTTPRAFHTAIWTGSEMIIWGGFGFVGTANNPGSRYNPATNTWLPIQADPAVPLLYSNAAVWTGTEMIVWGGYDMNGDYHNSGARYNPTTDTWALIDSGANAPVGRENFTTAWTGTEMIIWGGINTGLNTVPPGARYNPATDTWASVSSGAGYITPRMNASAVWIGDQVLIWGGQDSAAGATNTGAKLRLPGGTYLAPVEQRFYYFKKD